MLKKTLFIGTDACRWAKAMLDCRGIEGVRVLQGFLSLSKKYPAHVINLASRTALQAGMFRLRPLKELIKRNTDKQQLEFTDSHPIIRPLSEYQNLISVSFRKECP